MSDELLRELVNGEMWTLYRWDEEAQQDVRASLRRVAETAYAAGVNAERERCAAAIKETATGRAT